MCGGSTNASQNGSCPEGALCGGLGCHDDQGNLLCGGEGCNGTMSSSLTALTDARKVSANVKAAMEELQAVSKKLQDIASQTQAVKNQTMDALEKAQRKKDYFEKSNKDLKDFIKKIKDFLTEEGADPDSILKVAQQVLEIRLPLDRTTLDNMTVQIRDSIANLSNVQSVINQTSQLIRGAEELLRKAKEAESRATAVGHQVNNTKQALSVSQMTIEKAKAALKAAGDNLNITKNSTAEVEKKLQQLEDQQTDAMMRLSNLSGGVDALKNKSEITRRMAEEALTLATNATHQAATVEQSLNDTEQRFHELQLKMASLGGNNGSLQNIEQKVRDTKREAEELLDRARTGMDHLDRVEKMLKSNEERMQEQREQLERLKEEAIDVRNIIQEQVKKYSTCT